MFTGINSNLISDHMIKRSETSKKFVPPLVLMLLNTALEAVGNALKPIEDPKSSLQLIEEDIRNIRISENPDNYKFNHPILLWWSPFSSKTELRTCPGVRKDYQCYITHQRHIRDHPMTSAIFFYGTEFSAVDLPLPRNSHEDWALVHEESPKNNALISQSSVIRLFNHTSTFRSESDLPLTFQYLESIEDLTDEVRDNKMQIFMRVLSRLSGFFQSRPTKSYIVLK